MTSGFKISKSRATIFIGIFLLLFVTLLDNTVFAFSVRQGMILVFLSGILFLSQFRKIMFRINSFTALFVLGLIFILLNNYEFGKQNYIYELSFVVLVIILFSAQRTYIVWHEFFFKFILYFGLLCAVVTFVCYFVPEFYTSIILPNALDVYYNSLVYCFRMGYQPGIATHYSSNGMYLAMLCGCIFSMYITSNSKKLRYLLMTIFAVVALLLTAKRAHVLFGIASMLTMYYMRNIDKKRTRLFQTIMIIVIGLVLFVIIGQFIPSISGFINRFMEADERGDLLNNRSTLYAYALLLFSQNPILGNGWGSFKYLRESFFGEYNNAHNVFLQLLAETGLIGTIIFLNIILYMLIVAIRTFHKMSIDRSSYTSKEYCSAAFSLYMQVFFFLYCFTGNPLYDRLIWIPTVLSAAVSYYLGKQPTSLGKF